MELSETLIAGLSVDEIAIMKRIATELAVRTDQVSAVVSLIGEGCTIPFISRYRKERTGNLDEVQVRDSAHLFGSYKNLEERRIEVVKGIFALGKLDEALYLNLSKAITLSEIEDIWTPFKKKKKTRGMVAQEKGLSPLAEIILAGDEAAVEAAAPSYVKEDAEHPELSVATALDAIAGAKDIVAERMSQNPDNRQALKGFYLRTGLMKTAGVGDEAKREVSNYQMYWDYAEPLNQLKPHRVLAINRAEREGELTVTFEVDEAMSITFMKDRIVPSNRYHADAIEDGIGRLLAPAVLREIRSEALDNAEGHSMMVFSENLRNLLMTPPIKGTRVLGIDPGIRTGTKCACLDETGKYLDYFIIFQELKAEDGRKAIAAAVRKHGLTLIAVGNGTGSHEVQLLVAKTIEEEGLECAFTVVDEDGASVYSASDVAREEFPDLDLTVRGAISIGHRLQDPLAELVKIDPKSIGVGMYQHDVNQKRLTENLDEVVGSVVNNVGVNLNTASHSLLRYVSGINSGLAKKIVKFRDLKGAITSRTTLREIPGLGEKTFEQCAGFLKIPESSNPLDNTWVHPENYPLAEELLPVLQAGGDVTHDLRVVLKAKYSVGDVTLDDILTELRKPNRDPREGFPAPILQKGVVEFDDLKEGMKVRGKIKNVVDFGAFVDIGIKESALIHVSEMADRFVRDPMEVLKVGDVREFTIISLDQARRRIGLSLKTTGRAGERPAGDRGGRHEGPGPRPEATAGSADRPVPPRGDRPQARPYQDTRQGAGTRHQEAGFGAAGTQDNRLPPPGGQGQDGHAGPRRIVAVRKGPGAGPAAGEQAGEQRSAVPRPAPSAAPRDNSRQERTDRPERPAAAPAPRQWQDRRPEERRPEERRDRPFDGSRDSTGRDNPGRGGPADRGPQAPRREMPPRAEREDDGMTYNPFAELLKNRKR